jgi:hypothetical protein
MRRHVKFNNPARRIPILGYPISVLLLFALFMDLLLIRCMVGSVMGRCYLQNELLNEPKHSVLTQDRFRSYPDGTLNG